MSDYINNINQSSGASRTQPSTQQSNASQPADGASFSDALEQANIKFSNHAQKRLETRSIEMNENNMNRLSSAVDKAQAHGAKESLILMDDLAFVVNVRDRMVVTTVDMNRRKEGVFTQIDTVVFADPSQNNSSQAVTKTDAADGTEAAATDKQA
jgi:flagellar operon protein